MFILKKNVKWSPDGCRVEVVAAGSYQMVSYQIAF